MKNQLYFGQPSSLEYDLVLDMFSGTKINSNRTSSIPLVQFWKDTDAKLQKLLSKIDSNLGFEKDISLCFEYPTKPLQGKGKASMTDLMILCGNYKIAIEAKFTEYTNGGDTENITKWLKSGDNPENRKLVLGYWKGLIKKFSDDLSEEKIGEINYQFFHRTASACHNTKNACVVYQVFYDEDTKKDMEAYIEELKSYVGLINPKEVLEYWVWKVKTQQIIKDKEESPFQYMKSKEAYKFLKDELIKIG